MLFLEIVVAVFVGLVLYHHFGEVIELLHNAAIVGLALLLLIGAPLAVWHFGEPAVFVLGGIGLVGMLIEAGITRYRKPSTQGSPPE